MNTVRRCPLGFDLRVSPASSDPKSFVRDGSYLGIDRIGWEHPSEGFNPPDRERPQINGFLYPTLESLVTGFPEEALTAFWLISVSVLSFDRSCKDIIGEHTILTPIHVNTSGSSDIQPLGYDVTDTFFSSALCSIGGLDMISYPINNHGLISDPESAFAAAQLMDKEAIDHRPFLVIQVDRINSIPCLTHQ